MKRATLILIFLAFVCARGFAQSGPDTNSFGGLQPVEPVNAPGYATFWFTSTLDANGYFGAPLPWNPFASNSDVPIYHWPAHSNAYVIDDLVLPPENREQSSVNMAGTGLAASRQSFSANSAQGEGSGGD